MSIAVFDWDDTLCPTHWLSEQGLLYYHVPTYDQWCTLQHHATRLERILTRALKTCDHVYILTNSMNRWVQNTVARFFPTCISILTRVEICHAWKEIYEDVHEWKIDYMNQHLRHLKDATNILCFGDRDNDTNTMMDFFSGKRFKIIQVQETPDILTCMKQLDYIYTHWDILYASNKTIIAYL